MRQDALFLASCALVLFVKLARDAWKHRQQRRVCERINAAAFAAWDRENARDCVAEGLGPRIKRRTPSRIVWLGRLDRSAIEALRDIRRQKA